MDFVNVELRFNPSIRFTKEFAVLRRPSHNASIARGRALPQDSTDQISTYNTTRTGIVDTPFSPRKSVHSACIKLQTVACGGNSSESRRAPLALIKHPCAVRSLYRSNSRIRSITTASRSASDLIPNDHLAVPGANQVPSADFMEIHGKREGKRDTTSITATSWKNAEFPGKERSNLPVNTKPCVTKEYRQRKPWQVQKSALQSKFGPTGWSPRKRLSPDALEGIRALNAKYPKKYTTPVLADQFQVSPEAVRRILKSKWKANEEEELERRQRWDKRGAAIWSSMVEIGIKPPKKWKDMGIGKGRNRRAGWAGELRASMWDSGDASHGGHEAGSGASLSDRIL